MPIDEFRFRQALGYFATGVTVVTTAHEGRFYGLTVSSFTSLSLHPPLILICIDNQSNARQAIQGAGCFAVNVLEQHQEHLSRRFATPYEDKFTGIAWYEGQQGNPLLEGALTQIECRLHGTLPGGDHTIFVGEVMNATINEGMPLLYYRGGYREMK